MRTIRLLVLCLAVAVGGCTSSNPAVPSSSVSVFEPRDDSGAGNQALLEAEVGVIDGCAVVRSKSHGEVFIPIFPVGDDRIDEMTPGESIELGGSGSPRPPDQSTIPNECDGVSEKYWIVH